MLALWLTISDVWEDGTDEKYEKNVSLILAGSLLLSLAACAGQNLRDWKQN